jgi:phosphoribosylamine--glycine ligase
MIDNKPLNILLLGSGGREHALAWKMAQSPRCGRLFIAPGNAGTAEIGRNVPLHADDVPALLTFARTNAIDLTVVGPEAPLAAGIVDTFQAAGLTIFGPSRAAAQLEASKAFAKAFMQQHAIPSARYAVFSSYAAARSYLHQLPDAAVVVKASGLAAGKGVIVCDSHAQADDALAAMLRDQHFGAAGAQVVIEERLTGVEVSLLAFADGKTVVPMVAARDHKRVFDGDLGPNTGGMGAFAPTPDVDATWVTHIVDTVLQPTVDGMAAAGTPYVGVLYAGLMLTPRGPQVLEFNCRFGDPETQVIMPLLRSDLVELFLACCAGRLAAAAVDFHPGACATVVLASPGYPGSYPKGLPIHGLAAASAQHDVVIFHAGTAQHDGQLVTAGGRVLAVTALGSDLAAALQHAYAAVDLVDFEGMHYRRDIGRSAHTPN